jgi:hypothetical protein
MDVALMSKVFGAVAAPMWLVSAGLWAYSASKPIRDDIDVIVGDLQRAAYWNGYHRLHCSRGKWGCCSVRGVSLIEHRTCSTLTRRAIK